MQVPARLLQLWRDELAADFAFCEAGFIHEVGYRESKKSGESDGDSHLKELHPRSQL